MNQEFTDEAKILWEVIPQHRKERLIDNVWCSSCKEVTTITNFKGRIENRDLILTGRCAKCGKNVIRVIESE